MAYPTRHPMLPWHPWHPWQPGPLSTEPEKTASLTPIHTENSAIVPRTSVVLLHGQGMATVLSMSLSGVSPGKSGRPFLVTSCDSVRFLRAPAVVFTLNCSKKSMTLNAQQTAGSKSDHVSFLQGKQFSNRLNLHL